MFAYTNISVRLRSLTINIAISSFNFRLQFSSESSPDVFYTRFPAIRLQNTLNRFSFFFFFIWYTFVADPPFVHIYFIRWSFTLTSLILSVSAVASIWSWYKNVWRGVNLSLSLSNCSKSLPSLSKGAPDVHLVSPPADVWFSWKVAYG